MTQNTSHSRKQEVIVATRDAAALQSVEVEHEVTLLAAASANTQRDPGFLTNDPGSVLYSGLMTD